MTETYDVQTGPQFTKDSPRPVLQVAVGVSGGQPVASLVSLYWFFRDSADWNLVAGNTDKVFGLDAAAEAIADLYDTMAARVPA